MIGEIFLIVLVVIFFLILIVEIQNLRIISTLKNEHHDRINMIEEALNKDGINAEDLKIGDV